MVIRRLGSSCSVIRAQDRCRLCVGLYRGVSHPYQLTFPHFLPQWLVKRAIETKEEMGDYIRCYSVSQFQRTYSLPEVRALSSSS